VSKKQKQLLFALVIGLLVTFATKMYLESRISEYRDAKRTSVVRAKKQLRAGTRLSRSMVEKASVPTRYVPKARVKWSQLNDILGQELNDDVIAGDYVLTSYFRTIGTVGAVLSEQLEGENYRAITLPVNDTNSLSRSIVTGDKIDIVLTFNAPPIREKISIILLQNVPVISTGSYSAAEQELGARGVRAKRYNSITLRLSARDAMRLNYARQEGQISILLRNSKDSNTLDLPPIAGVLDLLDTSEKDMVKKIEARRMEATRVEGERFKEQVKALMKMQRQQAK